MTREESAERVLQINTRINAINTQMEAAHIEMHDLYHELDGIVQRLAIEDPEPPKNNVVDLKDHL